MKKSAIFSWILALALISCVMFAGCGNTVGPVGDDIPGTLKAASNADWTLMIGETYTNSYTLTETLKSWFAKYGVNWEGSHNPGLNNLKATVSLNVTAADTGTLVIDFEADVSNGVYNDADFTAVFAVDVATLVADPENGFPADFSTKPTISDNDDSAEVTEGKLAATQTFDDISLDWDNKVTFTKVDGAINSITLPVGFNEIVDLPRITLSK